MTSLQPRAVLLTRETDYENLIASHSTQAQTRFFLQSRQQNLDEVFARHQAFHAVARQMKAAIPEEWRTASVQRADLDRFLFTPEDVVVAIGQDGLVANVAKYLTGQSVLGVNPAPDLYEGVLVPLAPPLACALLAATAAGAVAIERRTLAKAVLDDGQSLQALNEIFIGHRSHQSARYVISVDSESEVHSSSGVIVTTGTGASGWARSIMTATSHQLPLGPVERELAFFVREPWPSVSTGASIVFGGLGLGQRLAIRSQMNEGGVVFADGVEQDHLNFDWGRTVTVEVSSDTLNLVRGR